MEEKTLYISLPIGKLNCPVCVKSGILVSRKRDGLKKHMNTDHGPGWELTYVCCGTQFPCRQKRYALKEAKEHWKEAHPGQEVEPENHHGSCSLDAACQHAATPPPLVRARSAAATARNALRHRRPPGTPPRTTPAARPNSPPRLPAPTPVAVRPFYTPASPRTEQRGTSPLIQEQCDPTSSQSLPQAPATPLQRGPPPSPTEQRGTIPPLQELRDPSPTAPTPVAVRPSSPPATRLQRGPPHTPTDDRLASSPLQSECDSSPVPPTSQAARPILPITAPAPTPVAVRPSTPPATRLQRGPYPNPTEQRGTSSPMRNECDPFPVPPTCQAARPTTPITNTPTPAPRPSSPPSPTTPVMVPTVPTGPLPSPPTPPNPPTSPPSALPCSPVPTDDVLPRELSAWQRQWLPRFHADTPWDDFLGTLQELITSLSPTSPPNQRQHRAQRPRKNNQGHKEAARLQRLYRMTPRRAMREVLQDSSPMCRIHDTTITEHFEGCHAPREGCKDDPPMGCHIPRAPTPPPLLDHVSPAEVALILKKTHNTAPGPDGVRYAVWRQKDPSGHVLSAVFNICLKARRFPPAWKESATVLIHKKGAVEEITNWRPIALSNTAGKLLCSLLADRLSHWASTHSLISEAQKGFTPSEGCLEHNYILQELLDNANRKGSELCIAWLDLANAFGSVPHSALLTALQSAGLTPDQLCLIKDLYEGSSTTIRHAKGATPPIAFGAGVRQGCPLSPILFNLVMEFLIRPLTALEGQHGATIHGHNISVLAYADDLALVARSDASLQALIDATVPAATWVGLKFKPSKCATLHVAKRRTQPTAFQIYGSPLQVLQDGEAYQHLGVPTGFRADQTPVATIARLEEEASVIFKSALAPWQKLHALRTFTVPQLEFNLKTARIKKTALGSLDRTIKRGCKEVFNLPTRASAELVYLPPSSGGAGLIPLADLSDLAAVSHTFRLLTSPDPRVASIALEGLAVSAGQRSAELAGMDFLTSYLNGDITGYTNATSTFSTARAAMNRLSKKLPDLRWNFSAARGTLELRVPGPRQTTIIDRGARQALSSSLRAAMQHMYRTHLAAKPDQGRVARVTTTCTTANHMVNEGRYTRFADWRFLHRARLNVLPLNGCRRWGPNDRRCRRCGRQDETTAHVLCHCTAHLATAITKRHNAVLDLLAAALRPSEEEAVRLNQRIPLEDLTGKNPNTFPEAIARCRPDMVIINKNKKLIKIVDVTVPYEDGWQAIEAARATKHQAYSPLAQTLRAEGYNVTVDAFVIGALGTWDSANWSTLARLQISRRYGITLSRRCVSETIRWSRDIYVTHVTGAQQWKD